MAVTLQAVAQMHSSMFPDVRRTPEHSALWSHYYCILLAMEAMDSALEELDNAGYAQWTAPMFSASKDISHALDELAEQLRRDTGENDEIEDDDWVADGE